MFKKILASFKIIKLIKNWPTYFLDFFGLINKKFIYYYLRNGILIKLRANSTDRATFNEIFIYDTYFKNFVKKIKYPLILDLGGHIGLFSLYISQFSKNSKIIAVEPDQENIDIFKENIKKNKLNVEIIEGVIGNKLGVSNFFISKNKLSNSLFNKEGDMKKTNSFTLEDIFKIKKLSKINILKMDIEGAEYFILNKKNSRLLKKIETIVMEYHNLDKDKNINRIISLLKGKYYLSIQKDNKNQGILLAIKK